MRQKNFEGNLDTSPSLLAINLFATGIFLKHSTEWFPCEVFRHCEIENFSMENRDTLLHKSTESVVELMLVKTLDTNFKIGSFVFNRLQKLIEIFVVGRKICRC